MNFQETEEDKSDKQGECPQKTKAHLTKTKLFVEQLTKEYADSTKNTNRKLNQKHPIHNRQTGSAGIDTFKKIFNIFLLQDGPLQAASRVACREPIQSLALRIDGAALGWD